MSDDDFRAVLWSTPETPFVHDKTYRLTSRICDEHPFCIVAWWDDEPDVVRHSSEHLAEDAPTP